MKSVDHYPGFSKFYFFLVIKILEYSSLARSTSFKVVLHLGHCNADFPQVRQEDIVRDVPLEIAKKRFELKLDQLGPYECDYTRNGKDLLLAGRKGHVAAMDWRDGKLHCELQLAETVRDARWLHNNQYFAVAQKKYVYIYDRAGVELHCLKKHIEVTNMEFLPYHYLLATVVCVSNSMV